LVLLDLSPPHLSLHILWSQTGAADGQRWGGGADIVAWLKENECAKYAELFKKVRT